MDAFKKVDDLVSKPILGSDGAQAWQNFAKSEQGNKAQQQQQKLNSSSGGAPQAPLKAQERAMGYKTWQDEQRDEAKRRNDTGETTEGITYTHFKQKQPQKKRKNTTEASAGENLDDDQDDNHYAVQDDDNNDSEKPTQIIANEKSSAAVDDDVRKPNKKSKRRTVAVPTIVHDPTHPLEQVAAAMIQRSTTVTNDDMDDDLPDGWKCAHDPNTNKRYYYQSTTGQTSWTKPTAANSATTTTATTSNDDDAAPLASITLALPDGWTTAIDPTTGKTYYYHAPTQITQWDPPNSFAAATTTNTTK
eukprot:scaffold4292_cov114-Amphora_coffeaeformis.AAC.2